MNPAWLVSARFDLVVYAGSALWGAIAVLALGRHVEPIRLWFWLNVVLTVAHYGPTWLRAYADRDERRRNRWSLYVFPAAVIGFAVATRATPEVLAFITFLWDRWHAVMQNYGFMRLYDAKAGLRAAHRARLDLALLFAGAALFLSLNMGLLAPALSALSSIGLEPIRSARAIVILQICVGVVFGIVALCWIVVGLRVPREQRGRQLPRLAFVVLLFGGHGIMNLTSNIFLLSAHEKIYHSLQYVVLTWHYSRRRAEVAPAQATGPLFRAVFAPGRWPLYVALTAAWTILVYAANRIAGGEPGAPGTFTALLGGIALCHYYFDSFLWRVRRPQVRESL